MGPSYTQLGRADVPGNSATFTVYGYVSEFFGHTRVKQRCTY